MAKYFNFFPTIPYYVDKENTSVDLITNLMSRFKFDDTFVNNTVVYYDYIITDGETPEVIADKLYGSPERHWIILNLNSIVNPYLDWPMSNQTLSAYIEKKYVAQADTANNETGIEWAQSNIKEYIKKEKRTILPENTTQEIITIVTSEDYANTLVTTTEHTLNDGTQIIIETTKQTKNYYDYEIEENDKKRTIKILKSEFISSIEDEFKKVI